jgi:peptidoglycan hydrolase-like protein with peptidoglycan-binding domain
MPALSYRRPGLTLKRGGTDASDRQIRDLQRDLRALGYLKRGIDGNFASGTERAVRALQHDLLHNDGSSTGTDGSAAIAVREFNASRVTAVTGEVDQAMVECISALLDEPRIGRLPSSADPRADNRRIVDVIRSMVSSLVPTPFLVAILEQESGLRHFNEPKPGDEDTFITVGLDARTPDSEVITSRGYGAGQFTLFHHPARPEEVTAFMTSPTGNLQRAIRELRDKFDGFVNGPSSRADDRIAEAGTVPLRECRFGTGESARFVECRSCALNAGVVTIVEDVTPVFTASPLIFHSTANYNMPASRAVYADVPRRAGIECDWPYAARRYNGGGIDSYHYQVRILKHVLGADV